MLKTPENKVKKTSLDKKSKSTLQTNSLIFHGNLTDTPAEENSRAGSMFLTRVRELMASAENEDTPMLTTKRLVNKSNERNFICEICDKRFGYRHHLTLHTKIHTREYNVHCEHCDKAFIDNANYRKHLRTHTGEKPYKCQYCGKCYSDATNKRVHERLHTGERPYKCRYCLKDFHHGSSWRACERSHTGGYPCPECGHPCRSLQALKAHKRVQHEALRFVCDICAKTFSSRSGFTEHVRTHTGERPFSCTHCGKSFMRSKTYNQHLKTHNISNTYGISNSNEPSSISSDLKNHKRAEQGSIESTKSSEKMQKYISPSQQLIKEADMDHCQEQHVTVWSCKECDKIFQERNDFERHYKVHLSTMTNYSCQHCGKIFGTDLALKSHQLTHTCEKSCVCNECGKTFTGAGSLRRHMSIHTGSSRNHFEVSEALKSDGSNFIKGEKIDDGNLCQHFCLKCDRSYKLRSHLLFHQLRSNRNLVQRVCQFCGESFLCLSRLYIHIERYHRISDISKICPYCDRNTWNRALLKHIHSSNIVPKKDTVRNFKITAKNNDLIKK